MSITKQINCAIGLLILFVTVGCAENGLPPGAHVVGGGVQIDWTVPQAGTVILVEKTTGRTVATKSVAAKGDSFTFDASQEGDALVLKAAFGAIPSNAHFVLYFVPAPDNS